jgi:hypothetical protein
LTYANVTATLALFVALGGASYAVTQLPANSVGTSQLKAHAVTSSKLARNATAPNANKLSGHGVGFFRLHCAPGTRAALGVCFEPSQRPAADFYVANDTCQARGGRLPTVGEMEAALDVSGLLPAVRTPEITGNVMYDTSTNQQDDLLAPEVLFGFRPVPTSEAHVYRCVFAPSN